MVGECPLARCTSGKPAAIELCFIRRKTREHTSHDRNCLKWRVKIGFEWIIRARSVMLAKLSPRKS